LNRRVVLPASQSPAGVSIAGVVRDGGPTPYELGPNASTQIYPPAALFFLHRGLEPGQLRQLRRPSRRAK